VILHSRPHIHVIMRGGKAGALARKFSTRNRKVVIYKHKVEGTVVLAVALSGGRMNELHIFKRWPSVTGYDLETISRKLNPNQITAWEDKALLRESRDTEMERKARLGRSFRETWRRAKYNHRNKVDKDNAVFNPPRLSGES